MSYKYHIGHIDATIQIDVSHKRTFFNSCYDSVTAAHHSGSKYYNVYCTVFYYCNWRIS